MAILQLQLICILCSYILCYCIYLCLIITVSLKLPLLSQVYLGKLQREDDEIIELYQYLSIEQGPGLGLEDFAAVDDFYGRTATQTLKIKTSSLIFHH